MSQKGAQKRKTLPNDMRQLLESGDIPLLKERFLQCEPNAVTGKYGSNIFSLTPLPRAFAVWARERGADVNFRDRRGKTPVFQHASAWNGDVQLLIDLGAQIDAARRDGTTPLHLASIFGRTNAVRALLSAGADVNCRTNRLDWPGPLTPLDETLLQNRLPYPVLLEVCTLLLRHGAEPTEQTREFLRRSAENFQRVKGGIKDPAYLRQQTEGLEGLYAILRVRPVGEALFHNEPQSPYPACPAPAE